MTKPELIDAVAQRAESTKKIATAAIEATFDIITQTLATGEKVQIIGFGTFEPRPRAARTGRNPQNGDAIEIAATTGVGFKPGKTLKDAVA
jgi:DNA-binding protein HU-beta